MGLTDNSKKRVWVSWKQVCNPKEEGGLGVRKLTDVMNAFRMKVAWHMSNSSSLHVAFMKARYGDLSHDVSTVKGLARWKSINRAWSRMRKNIRWDIGSGDISFWSEPWMIKGCIKDMNQVFVS